MTSPQRTVLDLAATESLWTVRGALAELEYGFGIEPGDLLGTIRRGHPGSGRLREAIASHVPELARTRSELERAFLKFLAEYGFPIPEFNCRMGPATVDAAFRDHRVVVELDGVKGHSGERRVLRDHRRDLHRRADGFVPLRYHYAQIVGEPELVAEDLERAGLPRDLVRRRAA